MMSGSDTDGLYANSELDNFAEMNSVYEKYFTHKPSRSCVAVKELPKGEVLLNTAPNNRAFANCTHYAAGVPVEIECIALSE